MTGDSTWEQEESPWNVDPTRFAARHATDRLSIRTINRVDALGAHGGSVGPFTGGLTASMMSRLLVSRPLP